MYGFRFVLLLLGVNLVLPILGGHLGYTGYFNAVPPFFNTIPHFPASTAPLIYHHAAIPYTRPLFSYSFSVGPSYPTTAAHTTVSQDIYMPQKGGQLPEAFRGFSYQTRIDGSTSSVVFVRGPEAKSIVQKSIDFFRNITPQPPAAQDVSDKPESNSETESTTNTPETSTPVSTKQVPKPHQLHLYPAHVSPLIAPAIPLHTLIPAFVHSLQAGNTEKHEDSSPEEEGEAQESMISEVAKSVLTEKPEEEAHTKEVHQPETKQVEDVAEPTQPANPEILHNEIAHTDEHPSTTTTTEAPTETEAATSSNDHENEDHSISNEHLNGTPEPSHEIKEHPHEVNKNQHEINEHPHEVNEHQHEITEHSHEITKHSHGSIDMTTTE